MANHLAARTELKAVLGTVVELAKGLIQADIATVYIYDSQKNTFELARAIGASRQFERYAMPREEGPTAWIVKNKNPLISNNAMAHPIFKDSSFTRSENVGSAAGFPMIMDDTVVGVLYLNYHATNQITEDRKRSIALFAQLAAIAIENTSLLEILTTLHRVSCSILSIRELPRVLKQIAQTAVDALKIDAVTVYEYDQAISEFKLPPVMAGILKELEIPQRTRIYEDDAAVIIIHRGIDWYFTPDSQHDPIMCGEYSVVHEGRPKKRFVEREGIVSSGVGQLKASGETVGVMFVNYRTSQQFSDEQQAVIKLFANHAAIAIQNARLHERTSEKLAEEYKRRLDAESMARFNSIAGTFFHRIVREIGTIPLATRELRRKIPRSIPDYEKNILWYLDSIEADAKRFVAMAKGIRQPFQPMDVKPADINQQLSEALKQTEIPSNITVVPELASQLPVISIDTGQLIAVFRNILDNAVEAMPNGGVLTVRTSAITDDMRRWIEVDISDTGKGISRETLEKIFYPFQSGKKNGIGVGLWQCKTFLERIGGKIDVESQVGQGCTFIITLPVAR